MADNINNFLKNIKQIESSGGKNISHKNIESGIHSGTSAIGRYGLMPNTIKEIIRREKMAGNKDPELDLLESLKPDELKDYINENPELEDKLAKSLASRILNKFSNEEQAAYAWNMGHNLTPEQLEKRGYESHPYVEKYRKYNELNREPNSEPQDVYNTDKVMLASQTSAPLPHFANTKGEVPEYPNLIKSFLNSVEEGVDELNSYRKNLQKKLNLSDEVVKSVLWQIAASAALGSVKKIGKIANKFTKSAISKKQFPKAIAKKFLAAEEKHILNSLANDLKEEVTEISKMPKSATLKKISSPAVADDFLEPSYFAKPPVAEEEAILNRLADNLKDEATEISKKPKKIAIPKRQPSSAIADEFLEPSYFAKPPVAEEVSMLNRLADNLKDEATEISKKPKPSPMPKRRPPIAEIDKGEDEITRRINALIKSESRFPKRKPSPRIIEELKEPSYFAKPPVAEEEAILKRLVDSLNREIK